MYNFVSLVTLKMKDVKISPVPVRKWSSCDCGNYLIHVAPL